MPDTAEAELSAWVASFVAEASGADQVSAFVDHVDARILRQIPQLAAEPALVADLHASTAAQYQVFLSLLGRGRRELLLPPQAVDLALSIARRRLELEVLLKVYRVAAAAVWEFFTYVVRDMPNDGPDRTEALVYLWSHGGAWINEATEQLIAVFVAERDALLRGALERRTETVHALLRGDQLSTDTATADLAHPLRLGQTAVVLWSTGQASADTLDELNRVAGAVGRSVGAEPLSIAAGRSEVWCWLATSSPVEQDAVRAAVESPDVSPKVQAAMGSSHDGIIGFRRTHREAVDAQRHAAAVPGSSRLTAYADVELSCLVAGNDDGARSLVARELGQLGGDARGLDRVRETVAAYLDAGGNVDHVAATLFVHKNTVRYRLAQAEKLLGHPLTERRTELGLALQCLPRYGASSVQ